LVQRSRKAAGLVVQDVVEVFYDEQDSDSLKNSLTTHASATIKRIKTFPLPISLMPAGAIRRYEEEINDSDFGKKTVKLVLTFPCASVNVDEVSKLLSAEQASLAQHFAMYLQTMEYNRLMALASCSVTLGDVTVNLVKGVHYFSTANEMLKSSKDLQARYGIVITDEF